MGIIMSTQRKILAPVSRKLKASSKAKASSEPKSTTTTADQPVQPTQPKLETARRKKKPAGTGMFSSWFGQEEGYDEEEDSKNWEQPFAVPPPAVSPMFPLPSLTPASTPPALQGGDTFEKRQRDKKQPDKPAPVESQDVAPNKTKYGRKTKASKARTKAKTPNMNPVQAPTPSPPVSAASSVSLVAPEKVRVDAIPEARTTLFSLPLEVRDKIYGHLLTATTPVPVMRGWTQCYGRYRGGLEPAILSVCRQTYQEGIRLLYSSNTFMYQIRDAGNPIPEALDPTGYASSMAISLEPPPLSELKNRTKGRAPKRQKRAKPVARKSTVGDVNRVIYLAKYAHLLRRVEIMLESNRDAKQYGLAMAKAIQLLGNGEDGFHANLTSLQLSVTPMREKPGAINWTVVNFFANPAPTPDTGAGGGNKKPAKPAARPENFGVMDALSKLTVRLLHLTVYTPSSRRLDMTLDMTHRTSGSTDLRALLAHDDLVAAQRAETASASSEALNNLGLLIERACADTDQAVEDGWWTEYGPPQVAAVRSAMEGIETIPGRMKKYRSTWYEKVRDEYMAQPDHACCVRKVGRRLVADAE